MRQLCEQVSLLERGPCGTEIRTAIELLTDTGRRPEETGRPRWDCLRRDPDGSAVLVYDNHKRNRRDRGLPIPQTTAELITRQQRRVRERFPDTALTEAGSAAHTPPTGRGPISGGLLDTRHRDWIDALALGRRDDGTEFDTSKIVPYAYRHSYAQPHADAGVAINCPIEAARPPHPGCHPALLPNRTSTSPRRGGHRDRTRVSTGTATGSGVRPKPCWTGEHSRYAVTEVAVPYGRCAEPSNVHTGGGACPVRFRRPGCDHFRTDVGFLPDLTAYLDDLPRTRERLTAAIKGVDEWARADATPTDEEITRIRRLINRINTDIDGLDPTERAQIDEAITMVRPHRAAHPVALGMPITPTPPTTTAVTTP